MTTTDTAGRMERIAAQADAFAALIGVDAEAVMFDRYGVALTPSQADALIELLTHHA